MEQVAVEPVGGLLDDTTHSGACGAGLRQVVESVFDFLLHRVVKLGAASGEELDAVVRHGVVRSRNHHTHVGTVVVGEESDSRSGQHTDTQNVDALGSHAGRQRCGEHLTGDTRIAANNGQGTTPRRIRTASQHSGRSSTQPHCQRCGQSLIRQTADAISSEKTCHCC